MPCERATVASAPRSSPQDCIFQIGIQIGGNRFGGVEVIRLIECRGLISGHHSISSGHASRPAPGLSPLRRRHPGSTCRLRTAGRSSGRHARRNRRGSQARIKSSFPKRRRQRERVFRIPLSCPIEPFQDARSGTFITQTRQIGRDRLRAGRWASLGKGRSPLTPTLSLKGRGS